MSAWKTQGEINKNKKEQSTQPTPTGNSWIKFKTFGMSTQQTAISQLNQQDLDKLAKAGVIPPGTPIPILRVFAQSCAEHNLSPYKKEIYLFEYKGKYTTIVGIDGLRAKASRTGCFAGREDVKFDLQPDGAFKTATQLKAGNSKPQTATVTVGKQQVGGG